MDSKKRRLDYKRKWISAARCLGNTSQTVQTVVSDDSDGEEIFPLYELAFNPPNRCYLNESLCRAAEQSIDQSGTLGDSEEVTNEIWDRIDEHITLSSDSEEEEETGQNDNFSESLSSLAVKHQVKHNFLDDLLKLLKQNGHPDLPVTARTLLKTTKYVELETRSGMDYIYFGIKDKLLQTLTRYPSHLIEQVDTLHLSFNIDGIPLFKSSNKSLWPILCAIQNLKPVIVFPVALTLGESKPKDLDFLSDVIQEVKDLQIHGLHDTELSKAFHIHVQAFVCDAPAKAFVKSVKQYSGYHGCDKCAQRGVWKGRMTYPEVENLELRTDEAFRSQRIPEHHHGISPICDLAVDMVAIFPIDYMHQVCLGVMKRLLLAWLRGKREVKISAQQVDEVSRRLTDLAKFIPKVFARKPRSLSEVDRWKATEYRQFLLYTGKLALKDVLPSALYSHFLVLSTAICILVCPRLAQAQNLYAHKLLVYFISRGRELYGDEFLVYNVHSLVHLAEDVQIHGSLDNCSAFQFENHLQKLKKFVRSGKSPLVQITKRIEEAEIITPVQPSAIDSITETKPNNGYILANSSCCEVVSNSNQRDQEGEELFLCRLYKKTQPVFSSPCDSRLIGAYVVKDRNARMKLIARKLLSKKAVMIEQGQGKLIFLAILHEF